MNSDQITAADILKRVRAWCGDEYEWSKWKERRKAAKESQYGEDIPCMIEWEVRHASGGAMTEQGKAWRALRDAMGDVAKACDEGTWSQCMAGIDRAIKAVGT